MDSWEIFELDGSLRSSTNIVEFIAQFQIHNTVKSWSKSPDGKKVSIREIPLKHSLNLSSSPVKIISVEDDSEDRNMLSNCCVDSIQNLLKEKKPIVVSCLMSLSKKMRQDLRNSDERAARLLSFYRQDG